MVVIIIIVFSLSYIKLHANLSILHGIIASTSGQLWLDSGVGEEEASTLLSFVPNK